MWRTGRRHSICASLRGVRPPHPCAGNRRRCQSRPSSEKERLLQALSLHALRSSCGARRKCVPPTAKRWEGWWLTSCSTDQGIAVAEELPRRPWTRRTKSGARSSGNSTHTFASPSRSPARRRAIGRRAARLAGGRGGPLQRAVTALERELLAHLADEERLLVPILANIDAWGPIRLGLLHAEHAHQRAVLAVLTRQPTSPATTLLAGRTLSLCDDLPPDMEFEERAVLSEKVLRDDFVL